MKNKNKNILKLIVLYPFFLKMKKSIWLVISLSLLFIGSFTYWASCNEIENTTSVKDDCFCKEWYNWNNSKTECLKIDTSAKDTQLKEAIKWMYDNWLTQYDTPEKFWSNDYLTREQAAKFFTTFYSKVLNKKFNGNVDLKVFSDMNEANPELKQHISQAYNIWLFKGFRWKFMPKNKLTQAQAISVAIRMINWDLEQVKNAWYINYYEKAKKYWLLKRWDFDIVDLDRTYITRWDTAIILYALYNHIRSNNDNAAIDYNYELTTSINKCLDAEEENIWVFEDGTEDDMNNAISQILDACKESAKEIYNIWKIEENDSLQKAMLAVISYNISFYDKAKEIVPYKRMENMTETQEMESDKIWEALNDLINKFDKSFENLKHVQEEFKNDYGF